MTPKTTQKTAKEATRKATQTKAGKTTRKTAQEATQTKVRKTTQEGAQTKAGKTTRKTAKESAQIKVRKTTRKMTQKAAQTKAGKTARKTTQKAAQTKTGKTAQKAAQTKTGKTTRKTTRKATETKTQKMTLIELYRSYGEDGKKGKASRDLLEQTDWFYVNAEFDPKTGEALPQALSTFLARIAQPPVDETLHDRLWRITNHARASVERVFRALNESPRREQALLHIRAVRELDANSFMKLSGRPGRTIREKLKDKPYLYAVRRFQSVDLPENRLLKEFVIRLAELLEMRHDCLKEKEEDELLPKIKFWLLGDEAQSIGRWGNFPPNNTLLSHRDYRRIWDAWRWLQTLDDDINNDLLDFKARKKTMYLWRYEYGQKYSSCQYIFADMPVYFDYEKFTIEPWNKDLKESKKEIVRDFKKDEIFEPVCVDFTTLRPRYSASRNSSQGHKDYKSCVLNETYIWQRWEDKDKFVDIELYNSDAVFLHPDAETISSSDLFFSKDKKDEHLDSASHAFTSKLRKTFKNDTLIWLVPDFLNYFELVITRRNIKAGFHNTQSLPRSIAAVFDERFDYNIISEGSNIVVIDSIGGRTCYTKLIAGFDQKLKELIPETCGYYWERYPPIIDHDDSDDSQIKIYEIITVDENKNWTDSLRPQAPKIDVEALRNDKRIGQALYINLSESPVSGGIRFYDLQQKAGNIPLWRDHIPELKIKALTDDGSYKDCILVSRNTTIDPILGKAVQIKIYDTFTLPAGKSFYKFPLLQGEDEEEVGYSAKLESSSFPLDKDTVCNLNLTFTYGADDPYCLIFEPKNNEFPKVKTEWNKNEVITDAPAPSYPMSLSWEDLQKRPKLDGYGTSDLLDWIVSAIDKFQPQKRTVGIIKKSWDKDINNNRFITVECGENNVLIRIYENNFNYEFNNQDIQLGDKVSFELQESSGKFYGRKAINAKSEAYYFTRIIRKSLYYPFIEIWKDGRSISDKECPQEFTNNIKNKIAYLDSIINQTEIPKSVKNELIFLLTCTHRDTTEKCIKWITEQVEKQEIQNYRSIGFALGDVSQEWQQNLLSKLKSPLTEKSLRVFAYAIWHERHFINKFTITELNSILNVLKERLKQIRPCPPGKDEKDKWTVRNWVRSTAEPLELLLGLLRIRESPDSEIKMILQPNQKITREIAKQVENIIEIFTKTKAELFSRVQLIGLHKPESFSIPDLLYALRLYLTGDDGANAIRITSVSDNENE